MSQEPEALHSSQLGADAVPIVEFLISLSGARVQWATPLEQVLEDLRLAATEMGPSFAPAAGWSAFSSFLARGLSAGAVIITAKAAGVMTAHQHIFRTTRVFSDVRPVFRDHDVGRPEAAVIIHTLRIDYTEGDQTKVFYVAMDATDVQRLQHALERALQKADALRQHLSPTGITVLQEQET